MAIILVISFSFSFIVTHSESLPRGPKCFQDLFVVKFTLSPVTLLEQKDVDGSEEFGENGLHLGNGRLIRRTVEIKYWLKFNILSAMIQVD